MGSVTVSIKLPQHIGVGAAGPGYLGPVRHFAAEGEGIIVVDRSRTSVNRLAPGGSSHYTGGMADESSNRIHTSESSWRRPSAIVGRQFELESLNTALGVLITEGRGGLVFITGEAGIGKTRLAAELRTQALARGCRWLEGRYDKEGSLPYKPYAEAVRSYLSTDPPNSLTELAGPYSAEIARSFPEIAADLALTPQAPNAMGENAEARQRQMAGYATYSLV